MTETEFLALIEQVLNSVESQVDDWAVSHDIDIEMNRNGNVLNLVFGDGLHVVINSQTAVKELWLAACSGGFHYRYDGQYWKNTRGGLDFPDALSQILSVAAEVSITVQI